MTDIQAVIFDIGGVITASPVTAIRAWAAGCGVDYAVLGPLLAAPDGPWSRFEKSELTPEEFATAFRADCAAGGLTVDSAGFLAAFAQLPVRREVLAVIRHLHGRYRLGCITNNVRREGGNRHEILDLFDVVIESAKVGLRKPDTRIYQMACAQLGVTPEQTVFLDDFGVNLKGARTLGMTTIKVDETDSAIAELESALGIPLPRAKA